jgi:hypothetical protein
MVLIHRETSIANVVSRLKLIYVKARHSEKYIRISIHLAINDIILHQTLREGLTKD